VSSSAIRLHRGVRTVIGPLTREEASLDRPVAASSSVAPLVLIPPGYPNMTAGESAQLTARRSARLNADAAAAASARRDGCSPMPPLMS
jgi:hypothetical protein